MRILFISNYFPPFEIGGWEQLTQDVAQRLGQRDHDIYILTSNYQAKHVTKPEPNVARVLHLESADHVHYHPHYTLTHHWQERQNNKILIKSVADFDPDLIFIGGMWNLPVSLARQAESLLPGRVVYYIASYWPSELDAHSAYWSVSPQSGQMSLKKRWLGKLVQPLISGPARNQLAFHHVLCVSEYMKIFLIEQAEVPATNIQVVNNGIDHTEFEVRPMNTSFEDLSLIYAGRLNPDKGVHTVVEGVGHFVKSYPQKNVELSIIGSGAPEYETYLKQLVNNFNIANLTTFLPHVQREQMPLILAKHDILIFPSIWPEPLARMTQEAMACGLVVIGTTTGGTPEILQDGRNGLTFEAGNASMLAEKIAQVADNPEFRVQLAQAARRTVEEHFTIERMLDEIETYMSSVIQPKETSFV